MEKRYFLFGYTANDNKKNWHGNMGVSMALGKFPSNDYLKTIVEDKIKGSKDIIILSVCELNKEDYMLFFNITNP